MIRELRGHQRFERRFKLIETTEPDAVSATLDRGVLTARVPKVDAAKREPKRIDVLEVRKYKGELEWEGKKGTPTNGQALENLPNSSRGMKAEQYWQGTFS